MQRRRDCAPGAIAPGAQFLNVTWATEIDSAEDEGFEYDARVFEVGVGRDDGRVSRRRRSGRLAHRDDGRVSRRRRSGRLARRDDVSCRAAEGAGASRTSSHRRALLLLLLLLLRRPRRRRRGRARDQAARVAPLGAGQEVRRQERGLRRRRLGQLEDLLGRGTVY